MNLTKNDFDNQANKAAQQSRDACALLSKHADAQSEADKKAIGLVVAQMSAEIQMLEICVNDAQFDTDCQATLTESSKNSVAAAKKYLSANALNA